MSDNTITSADVAPKKVPAAFSDLNKEQLVAAALAFGADETGTKETIKAELLESGVTFEDYLKAFYPEEPVAVEEPIFVEAGEDEVITAPEPRTVEPEVSLAPTEKYLIKFVGENPYFEFGRYKFTREKPYGIMPARDAQNALVSEPTKFRQAFPAELEEFYS